jgi:amino acid adenylation domain-containing protein
MVAALPGAGNLRLGAHHDPRRVTASAARRLVAQLRQLLVGLAEQPGRPIGKLDLLPPAQHAELDRWNDTGGPAPSEPVYRLFEDLARRHPDRPALAHGDQTLSYGELDAAADRLAAALRARGVARDDIVAICLPRSIELVTAILAAHKAGGAFLVLDPRHPAAWIGSLIKDADPRVVLASHATKDHVPDDAVLLSDLASEPAPTGRIQAPGNLDALAYVVYTSGSTGRPKGVLIEHAGLRNVIGGHQQFWQLGPGDVVLQFCATGFDASILEFFHPLAYGACLRVADPEDLVPGQPLADTVTRYGITALTCTPSALAMLDEDETLPSVRTLSAVGEKCPGALVRRFAPGRRFFNFYGPAEAAITTTGLRCDPDVPGDPTIGHPIANMRAYVLDEAGRQVPVGVPGEVCVAGVGVARGYLGRPDLTAERFGPDPFVLGQRMYRTGDLARRTEEGDLEFLGRADHQIKVRGYRVEPGEVEAALLANKAVAKALVTAFGPAQARGLAAYLVLRHDPAVPAEKYRARAVSELHAHLSATLPPHLVPDAFIVLDEFPLSGNGKIDRAALPAPGAGLDTGRRAVLPRDSTELRVAGVFAAALQVRAVGATDNFFRIGGHSLLAIKAISGLRREFGREIDLRTLLGHPTVESMARLLRADPDVMARTPVATLHPGDQGTPLYLLQPAGGNLSAYLELCALIPAGQAVYGFEELNGVTAESTIEELAACYAITLRRVRPQGPYRLGGWSFGGLLAYEMARLLAEAGEHVEPVLLIDAVLPLPAPDLSARELAARRFGRFAHYLQAALGREVPFSAAEMAGLPEGEQLDRFVDSCVAAGFVSHDSQDIVRTIYLSYQRSMLIAERYRPATSTVPAVLLRATGRLPADAVDPQYDREEADAGWAAVCAERLTVVPVPGDHLSMVTDPCVVDLARVVVEHLALGASR